MWPRVGGGHARSHEAELFARFEILGEDGGPFAIDELPSRRALVTHSAQRGSALLPVALERRRTLVGRPLDADPDARGPRPARDQRLPRRHRRARRRGARSTSSPKRARCSLRRSTTRRRSPILPACSFPSIADYCIVDAFDETGRCGRSSSRTGTPSARSCCGSCGAASRRRKTTPIPSRGAQDTASRISSRTPGRRAAQAAVDEEHLALYARRSARSRTSSSRSRRVGGCSGRSPSARASRAGVRRSPTSRSRTRSRSRAAARDRQRAPLPRGAGVVRPARHHAPLGPGRDRLLGSRAPLRPRQRCARRTQPAVARGAHRDERSAR